MIEKVKKVSDEELELLNTGFLGVDWSILFKNIFE